MEGRVGGHGVVCLGRAGGGLVIELCQPNVFFSPGDTQPPLEENFPQEHMEVPLMQIPKEPSHLAQPVTRDMGTSGVAQKPQTEEDGDPGNMC